MMNKKVVVLITAVLLISILALSVYQQATEPEPVEELMHKKIIIHYGDDGETKILTSEMPEFREMGNISLKVIKSINMLLRMTVPADLKVNNTYVEIIFPETINISTKYDVQPNIELDAALIMLTGEYSNIIFTGKRGYINWTDDTGYFVENSSKNVLYMSAWESAVNVDGLRDIVERLKE